MKKIAKLSLVAAVAVLGFTSANAQSLEEAIKNVETSGSVVYRYNDYKNNANGQDTTKDVNTNNYKVALNLSSKVNEDVKFNSRFLVASETGDFGSLKYSDGGDQNVGVTLSHANFGYTGIKNTTVNVGKQGLATPWTVALDSDGNEQTGTGILALSTVGPVTLAGAYFNQTNLGTSGNGLPVSASTVAPIVTEEEADASNNATGSSDIATVGAIAAVGPVTLDAWYLDMNDTLDSYTIGAKSALDLSDVKVGIDARWASLDLDNNNNKQEMGKLVLTADAGLVDAKLAYAMTGNEGGLTALDNDAVTTLLGWNLALNGKTDADYVQAVLGFDVLSNLNLSANYGNLQYITTTTTDVEEEEVYAQLLYKMSKNLSTYVRYGTYTKDVTVSGVNTTKNDDTRGRLQVEYTF
jgi:hypothetical protein